MKYWILENGLTMEECAMIQPQYNFDPPGSATVRAPVSTGYAISSGIIGGVNTGASVFNLASRTTHTTKLLSSLSILSGTSEMILAAVNLRRPSIEYRINRTPVKTIYRAQNNLSYVNIAVGAATVATGVIHLLRKRIPNPKKAVFNLYAYPATAARLPIIGFTLNKTI